MRVLVCGGRDYKDIDNVYRVLNEIDGKTRITAVIQGGATGADELARQWAKTVGITPKTYKADWTKYGKAAGPIRNSQMAKESQADLCIAFPGGSGTADMVAKAKRADIPVRDLRQKSP